MTALDKLIEAVEAGALKGTYNDLVSFDRLCDDAIPADARGLNVHAFEAYEGSLNAALALHDALLPGWGYDAGYKSASVWSPSGGWGVFRKEHDSAPARAWLLAILRAYRSVQA